MTTEYDSMYMYLEQRNLLDDSMFVKVMKEEIIYFMNVTNNLYILNIGRKFDKNWSIECKRNLINMLKLNRKNIIYATINGNYECMSHLLISQGFIPSNMYEFVRI